MLGTSKTTKALPRAKATKQFLPAMAKSSGEFQHAADQKRGSVASRSAKSANAKVGGGVWRRIPIRLRRWMSGLGPATGPERMRRKNPRKFVMSRFASFELPQVLHRKLHRAPWPRSRKAWRSFPPPQMASLLAGLRWANAHLSCPSVGLRFGSMARFPNYVSKTPPSNFTTKLPG